MTGGLFLGDLRSRLGKDWPPSLRCGGAPQSPLPSRARGRAFEARGCAVNACGCAVDARECAVNARERAVDARGCEVDARGCEVDARECAVDARERAGNAQGAKPQGLSKNRPNPCQALFFPPP